MSSLSPEAQALLDGARGAGGPSAAQRASMKRAVIAATLVPATAAAVGGAAAPAAAAPAIAGGAGIAKFLVVGIISAAVGAGATFSVIGPSATAPVKLAPVAAKPMVPPERVPVPERLEAPVVPETPPEVIEPVKVAVKPVLEKPVVVRPSTPLGENGGDVPREAQPALAVPPPPTPPNSFVGARGGKVEDPALAREVSSLSGAMADVDAKKFSSALERLNRYRAEFPSGTLSIEARVLEVLSLCGLGREDEARSVVSALPQGTANNPAMRRIETSCASPQRIPKVPATQKIQGDDK